MIELLLLADVNFPEHKVYFVCPSVPGKDRKCWTNDTFPDCNKIRITLTELITRRPPKLDYILSFPQNNPPGESDICECYLL